jgi:hypothetical protein
MNDDILFDSYGVYEYQLSKLREKERGITNLLGVYFPLWQVVGD